MGSVSLDRCARVAFLGRDKVRFAASRTPKYLNSLNVLYQARHSQSFVVVPISVPDPGVSKLIKIL